MSEIDNKKEPIYHYIIGWVGVIACVAAIIYFCVFLQPKEAATIPLKYKPGDMVECLLDDKNGMVLESNTDGAGVNEYYIRFDSGKPPVWMKEFEIMDSEK